MRLLLCSDFKNVGYKYLNKFFDTSKAHNCLFIGYASDDFGNENAEIGSSEVRLNTLNFNVIQLNEAYDFSDKIDLIFVRGGNTTKLIYLLKKYKQFEKIDELVKSGVVYVGESAGAVLAGSDTEWTLRTEPFEINVKSEFGKNALLGYNYVNKLIFVHCSKLGFPFGRKINDALFRVNNVYYKDYLGDLKIYPKDSFITLGNNQVYYVNGQTKKIITYDWSKIPVKKNYN